MNTIKEHLKQQAFKPVYLLYGSEDYLKRLYRDKLKTGILNDGSDMNYSYFEGKGIDTVKIMDIADTLPFLAERRLIIIENSGFFKSQNSLANEIGTLPDTTHIIFVEQEVDKREREGSGSLKVHFKWYIFSNLTQFYEATFPKGSTISQ